MEVGADLAGADLTYVKSAHFATDDGNPVINVVFRGRGPELLTGRAPQRHEGWEDGAPRQQRGGDHPRSRRG